MPGNFSQEVKGLLRDGAARAIGIVTLPAVSGPLDDSPSTSPFRETYRSIRCFGTRIVLLRMRENLHGIGLDWDWDIDRRWRDWFTVTGRGGSVRNIRPAGDNPARRRAGMRPLARAGWFPVLRFPSLRWRSGRRKRSRQQAFSIRAAHAPPLALRAGRRRGAQGRPAGSLRGPR